MHIVKYQAVSQQYCILLPTSLCKCKVLPADALSHLLLLYGPCIARTMPDVCTILPQHLPWQSSKSQIIHLVVLCLRVRQPLPRHRVIVHRLLHCQVFAGEQ